MLRSLISASLVAALMAGTASADTLREALVSSYNSNPTLMSQRETQKATDANVAIAKAAGLTLRRITDVVESGGPAPLPVDAKTALPATGTPIEPGTQLVQATLTVTFAVA